MLNAAQLVSGHISRDIITLRRRIHFVNRFAEPAVISPSLPSFRVLTAKFLSFTTCFIEVESDDIRPGPTGGFSDCRGFLPDVQANRIAPPARARMKRPTSFAGDALVLLV